MTEGHVCSSLLVARSQQADSMGPHTLNCIKKMIQLTAWNRVECIETDRLQGRSERVTSCNLWTQWEIFLCSKCKRWPPDYQGIGVGYFTR